MRPGRGHKSTPRPDTSSTRIDNHVRATGSRPSIDVLGHVTLLAAVPRGSKAFKRTDGALKLAVPLRQMLNTAIPLDAVQDRLMVSVGSGAYVRSDMCFLTLITRIESVASSMSLLGAAPCRWGDREGRPNRPSAQRSFSMNWLTPRQAARESGNIY
jgi:hypothetical protein